MRDALEISLRRFAANYQCQMNFPTADEVAHFMAFLRLTGFQKLVISYHTLVAYLGYRPELGRGIAAAKRAGLPPATHAGAGGADGPQRCAPEQSGGLQW
jgi:hypothetical protein